jgi:hypothetical protein
MSDFPADVQKAASVFSDLSPQSERSTAR